MPEKESSHFVGRASLAYVVLFIPSFVAAAAHYLFMPKYIPMLSLEFGSLQFPPVTNLAVHSAPIHYLIPVAMLIFACLSGRFRTLNHPTVIGSIGAGIALWLYVYGIGTTMPLFTILDKIGNP